MKYKIIDNYLPYETFQNIKNILLENGIFPWYFENKLNYNHTKKDIDFYLSHNICEKNLQNSSYLNLFQIFIDNLKMKAILRIKCNLYPATQKIIQHPMHIDYDIEHKGALFYINTNNGYTEIEDNVKIKSIENRLLLFNPNKLHRSTNCTDEKARCNVIFNYI
jgi:hypothetical protein